MSRPLLALLGLFLLLGLGYALVTPPGQAPDESGHVRFVEHLAKDMRLPVLNLEHRKQVGPNGDIEFEAHQPPLYYALAVPFFQVGRLTGVANGEFYTCRLLSILIGVAGTALVWFLVREVAPDRPALWFAATAFAAFLPQRLAIFASVSNDALAEATGSLALLLMLRGLRLGWSPRQAVLLGLALVAALLTKQSGLLLLPVAALAVFLGARRTASAGAWAGTFVRTGAILAGVLALGTGWWFVRNQMLYGDPLAQRMFTEYFADTVRWVNFRDAQGMTFADYLSRLVFPTSFASFWGAFGHLDPTRPDLFMGAYGDGPPSPRWGYPPQSWVYPILLVLMLVSVGGGLRYYLRQRSLPDDAGFKAMANPRTGLLATHALLTFAAFLNFNATYFQGQGRYLFPAIGILAAGLCGGWLEWSRPREGAVRWVIAGGMLILALYALFGVLLPAFH